MPAWHCIKWVNTLLNIAHCWTRHGSAIPTFNRLSRLRHRSACLRSARRFVIILRFSILIGKQYKHVLEGLRRGRTGPQRLDILDCCGNGNESLANWVCKQPMTGCHPFVRTQQHTHSQRRDDIKTKRLSVNWN